jgi:hypothetical protein
MSYFISENCFLFFAGENAACFLLVPFLAHSLTVKKEAPCSSELSAGLQRSTKRCMLEDRTVRNCRCENHKSYIYPNTLRTFSAVAFYANIK